ncbi:MAG TPA: VTT domain-containing protein [Terriglobales bacterium]|nr:VTT domain-containing protein [Terriglobales bacterium]
MTRLPALALFASHTKAARSTKDSMLRWLVHLGGPGLILLGILDNSVIPLPGSMDVATIVLAAHRREPWIYYALMATLGAVIGGLITYRLARKGGKEALEKRFSKRKAEKIYRVFERWGFAAVAIPALLPPPFPIVPMLVAAGALQYPTKKFVTALGFGRGVRYVIIAYLGAKYGHGIIGFFSQYYMPTLIILIAASVAAGLYGLYEYKRRQKPQGTNKVTPSSTPARRVA